MKYRAELIGGAWAVASSGYRLDRLIQGREEQVISIQMVSDIHCCSCGRSAECVSSDDLNYCGRCCKHDGDGVNCVLLEDAEADDA